jgi:hypothetical protein
MASKWAWLLEKYPPLPLNEKYAGKVEAAMEDIAGQPLAVLAKRSDTLEAELAQAEQWVKNLEVQIDAVERVLHEQMEAQSLQSVVIDGYLWSSTYEPYPVVTNQAEVREWATKRMPDNLNLAWGTVRNAVRTALDPDTEPGTAELPPGVAVYVKRSFRRTKQ